MMRYIKLLGLTAVTAAALTAFAGPASALTLTDGSGKHPTSISMTSANWTLSNGVIHIGCGDSDISGSVNDNGTVTGKVAVTVSSFTLTECGEWTATVPKGGTLIFEGGGTVRSTGAEVTIESKGGLHCIFTTNNAKVGTLTESEPTGATAVIDLNGSEKAIERTGGRSGIFCGGNGTLKGSYTITNPDTLNMD